MLQPVALRTYQRQFYRVEDDLLHLFSLKKERRVLIGCVLTCREFSETLAKHLFRAVASVSTGDSTDIPVAGFKLIRSNISDMSFASGLVAFCR